MLDTHVLTDRIAGISHLVLHGWLFLCDTGGQRPGLHIQPPPQSFGELSSLHLATSATVFRWNSIIILPLTTVIHQNLLTHFTHTRSHLHNFYSYVLVTTYYGF